MTVEFYDYLKSMGGGLEGDKHITAVRDAVKRNLACSQNIRALYAAPQIRHDCGGCGAPLQRLAHHCEYCGRQP